MVQKSTGNPKQAPRPQRNSRSTSVPSKKEGGNLSRTEPKPTEVRGTGPRSPKSSK